MSSSRTQLICLFLARIVEPICYSSIFPFVNQMTERLLPKGTPKARVGSYSGMLESLFAICQVTSMFYWGRLSDRIGRKPVILSGLLLVSVCTVLFGSSTTFPAAVISRGLAGLLCGNMPALRALLKESTTAGNEGFIYALYCSAFDIAIVFAPALGGILADPAIQYKHSILNNEIFRKLPYLLPCLTVSFIAIVVFLICAFFLEETLPRIVRKKQKQAGIENTERDALLSGISVASSMNQETPSFFQLLKMPNIRQLFVAAFINVWTSLSFDSVFVLFCYSSVELGGLGLNAKAIALCLTFRGIISIISAVFLFAPAQRIIGSHTLYSILVSLWPFAYGLLPYMHSLAASSPDQYTSNGSMKSALYPWMITCMVLYSLGDIQFPLQMLALNANCPNEKILGAVNGVSMSIGALARAIGPFSINWLYSHSLTQNMPMLIWYIVVPLMVVFAAQSLLINFEPPESTEGN